ncbi:MAG: phenylalanine--tRNA ligase subunit alpha [Clostridia bacterium]
MKEKLIEIKQNYEEQISKVKDASEIENLRVEYLGKKGKITLLMPELRLVPNEQKKEMGMLINEVKGFIENSLSVLKEKKENELVMEKIKNAKPIDISLPVDIIKGSLHPRTIVQKEIEEIFISMGFIVEDGNEIETEYNNFDALNVPATHPARDMQDTFWLDNGQLLKTHTSASQNRLIKKYGTPCKILLPGRCYRNEAVDMSHEHTFFQVEGIVIDKNVTVANLIYFIKTMLTGVLKQDIDIRMRPGFFPFTEPSFEVDAKCPFCNGKGCSSCGKSGWIELVPCGMIHPNVLKEAGVDSDIYSGFAFGLGFDRLVMIKTKLDDIRNFTSGNVKLLKQFGLDL